MAIFIKYSSLYTGHCFRRPSTTLLADSGSILNMIKWHGGWKSSTVVEGFIEDSKEKKREIYFYILFSSSDVILSLNNGSISKNTLNSLRVQGIHIITNCKIEYCLNGLILEAFTYFFNLHKNEIENEISRISLKVINMQNVLFTAK